MSVHGQVRTLVELFGEVALSDPLSALLLAVGALLVGVSSLVFGYLALRGVGAVFSPQHGEGPPRQAR